jgi:hypothetical protein
MDSPALSNHTTVRAALKEQELTLDAGDRYELMSLQADVRIKQEELNVARVKLETAQLLSDAAGDRVLAKMLVPKDIERVTIDIVKGVLRFKTQASP